MSLAGSVETRRAGAAWPRLAAVLLAALLPGLPAWAQLPVDDGATGLGLALRRLPVAGRVLYVTAHPDDEPNGVLAELSRGRGLRVGLLTLTRGEGGQNALGPELFDALGVLRTEELQAVHGLDGAEQLFSRAFEFGFSFSVDETLGRWGREATLGDVVRAVRAFRPDVIFTLPLEARGEHSHHLAAARLAREAFRAAADPGRFPEAGLRPWQAARLYQGGTGGGPAELAGAPARIELGAYDALTGRSARQLGSLARAAHRSQSASQLEADPGPAEAAYALVDADPATASPGADPLDGLDLSLSGLLRFVPAEAPERADVARGLEAAQAQAREAQAAFGAGREERLLAALRGGLARLAEVRAAVAAAAWRVELDERLAFQQDLFEEALRRAHALTARVTPSDDLVTPGQAFAVSVEAWNAGREPLGVDGLELLVPPGWNATRREGGPQELPSGGALRATFDVRVADDARPSQPYWRRLEGSDRLELDVPADEGRPWSPPPVEALLSWRSGEARARLRAPALVRSERPAGGERRSELAVVPALDVSLSPELLVFPRGAGTARETRVRVVNQRPGPAEAVLRLSVPAGWRVEPAETRLGFAVEGEERLVVARVTAPAGAGPEAAELRAVVTLDGRDYSEGAQVVAYDHVQPRRLYRPARARLLPVDVRADPRAAVAYVRGLGDQVPEALRQLGLAVTELKGAELAAADLARFSTVVLGVRAYADAATRAQQSRLMGFVEGGGHLVVQLSRNEFNVAGAASRSVMGPGTRDGAGDSPFAPYPASVTTRRVTDENAPVTALAAGHPLLSRPNRLGPADWQGWVQERALQLLEARDPRYVEVLASADTFPENPGEKRGLLVEARVGRGTWTYVGLGLFRQLPAGVPGAYRLLANLVSRPRGK